MEYQAVCIPALLHAVPDGGGYPSMRATGMLNVIKNVIGSFCLATRDSFTDNDSALVSDFLPNHIRRPLDGRRDEFQQISRSLRSFSSLAPVKLWDKKDANPLLKQAKSSVVFPPLAA
jgi:hypothetical protein